MDDRVAEVKACHDPLCRIKPDYAADVQCECCYRAELELRRDERQTNRRTYVKLALTEANHAGPGLCEDAPLFKSLPDLHARESFCDVSVIPAPETALRKEVTRTFNRECLVEIVREASAESRLGSAC